MGVGGVGEERALARHGCHWGGAAGGGGASGHLCRASREEGAAEGMPPKRRAFSRRAARATQASALPLCSAPKTGVHSPWPVRSPSPKRQALSACSTRSTRPAAAAAAVRRRPCPRARRVARARPPRARTAPPAKHVTRGLERQGQRGRRGRCVVKTMGGLAITFVGPAGRLGSAYVHQLHAYPCIRRSINRSIHPPRP